MFMPEPNHISCLTITQLALLQLPLHFLNTYNMLFLLPSLPPVFVLSSYGVVFFFVPLMTFLGLGHLAASVIRCIYVDTSELLSRADFTWTTEARVNALVRLTSEASSAKSDVRVNCLRHVYAQIRSKLDHARVHAAQPPHWSTWPRGTVPHALPTR